MVVAVWNPARLAEGFAAAGRVAVVVALGARCVVDAEAAGLTGRGGLKAGPLRRAAGAALGGIVSVWRWQCGVVVS